MHQASSWSAARTFAAAVLAVRWPAVWLLAGLVLAALPTRAAAAPDAAVAAAAPAAAKIAYQRFELANGLRVYVIEDHKAPLVHEVLWFRVGSKDEVAERTGFAHLFEHLMFKGSAHVPDGRLDELLESAGGWSNAFTDRDMTVYQNVAASNFLEQMLWLEADRVAGLLPTLDQAKLDNQREVVLNERRQSYENQPYGMSELLLSEALWPAQHGYHWSTIGYPRDLRAAQLGDVASFFSTYYVPSNATMVIAGDVSFPEVKRLVEKYFAWMPRAPEPARPRYAEPPPLTKEVVLHATDDVQVPKVFLAWRGPRAFSAEEPAVDLALAILGEGKSSRLYKRLVYDEKIAQDVSAGMTEGELGGEVQIEVTAKPGVDAQRLLREISEEVARLASAPPDALALERAKSLYEASFLGGLEATLQRAIELARYDVMAGDPDFFAKDLARYRAVTAGQVQRAAAKFLQPSARVSLTISPGAKAAEEPAAASAPAPIAKKAKPAPLAKGFAGSPLSDWRKPPAPTAEPSFAPPVAVTRKLGNGMTLLVVENHQLPLVALTLLAPGAGTTADPPGKLGLAAFTADLLDEGAADLTPLAIAEEEDRLGAEIHAFADADSAGIVVRTLQKTLDPTIDLFAKILTRPRFDARELERVRGDRLTALGQRRDRPREVANLMLAGKLYGSHSRYGHPGAGYVDTVRAITLDDVRAFYSTQWDPAKMTLVVAGDVTVDAIFAKLERALAGWRAAPAPALPPKRPTSLSSAETGEIERALNLPLPPLRLLVADRPGAAQSDVRVGLVGPARSDPRFFAFEVLRTTLGDGFTSRLTQRLREELGITYGVGAGMDWRREPGTFSIGSALVTPATAQGISEILRIARDLARRDVPRAELEKSKQNMIRALPAELETNLAITGAFATLVELGLPLDWYAHYAAGVRKVTAAQVRQAAKELLPAPRFVVAIVGDWAKIRASIAKLSLGTPLLHDAYGLPLAPPAK